MSVNHAPCDSAKPVYPTINTTSFTLTLPSFFLTDHVVVLVGYGVDDETGTPYWLIRNSWSPTFGEAGYIRLLRETPENTKCGVDKTPQDGTGCDGAGTQYPCGQCGVVFDVSYPTGAFLA